MSKHDNEIFLELYEGRGMLAATIKRTPNILVNIPHVMQVTPYTKIGLYSVNCPAGQLQIVQVCVETAFIPSKPLWINVLERNGYKLINEFEMERSSKATCLFPRRYYSWIFDMPTNEEKEA